MGVPKKSKVKEEKKKEVESKKITEKIEVKNNAKSKTLLKKITKAIVKDKEAKESNKIILKGLSAIKTYISFYSIAKKDVLKRDYVSTSAKDDIAPQTIINDDEALIPVNELLHEKSRRAYYFFDMRKAQNKLWCNMIDVLNNGCLPNTTDKPCWWDRNRFKTRPIGCPIHYNSNKMVGVEKERFEERLKTANLPSDTNDFFETEGLFCSFPCVAAYILDKRNDVKYKDSLALLSLLYKILYDKDPDFPTADTWKVLKDYCGHLSIDEYRSSFGQLKYEESVNVRRPYMYSNSQYISERKVKLFRGVSDIN